MTEVSPWRLYVMRAFYLLIALAVGSMAWRTLTAPADLLGPVNGVAYSFWAALSLLAALGLRYPLQMTPILLLQMAYKSIWLGFVGLPLWSSGATDATTALFTRAMAMGVVLDLLVIPWGYVLDNYVRKPGADWRLGKPRMAAPD